MKAIQVAIYARVSRDKQETMNQLAQLREFCQRQSWVLVAEYIDHESGSVPTRANFQKMLLHASQRKFDVLLFWALDRLTREGTLATLQYLERLTSYQVGYKSCRNWIMAVSVAGRQLCKSTHTSNKRLAQKLLSRWETEVFEGRFYLPKSAPPAFAGPMSFSQKWRIRTPTSDMARPSGS